MAVVRWLFTDPVTLDVHEFDINPSPESAAQPEYNKQMSYEATAAADGQTIAYEGRREPQRFEWEGVTFTEEEHQTFVEWWEKGYQIDVTDDRDREWRVYLTNYRPKRAASLHYPDKREYQMSSLIIPT